MAPRAILNACFVFLCCLTFSFQTAMAAGRTIYFTSFEASEGYVAGQPLIGQNGWQNAGSGGDGLLTNVLPSQLQSAYLGFAAPTNNGSFHAVGYHVDFHPLTSQLPKATFSVQMAVFASTTTNQEWFDWTVFNTEGKKLFALEFPTGPGGNAILYKLGDADYVSTGSSYTNGLAYTLTVTMDFAANRWAASLDSTVLVTNQPIATAGEALTISEIDPQWTIRDVAHPGNDYMVFDDYRITAEPAPPPTAQVIFATSFEAAEGYQAGQPLFGQKGWQNAGSGGDGLITNVFSGELQSAYIGFGPPKSNDTFHAVGYHVDFYPLNSQLPKTTFSVQMAVFASTTTNQEWFDWAVFNTEGKKLFALEFPTGSGALPIFYKLGDAEYRDTGQSYTNGLAYPLTLSMDSAANRWSANLGSTVLVTNQPIASGSEALTISEIDPQWTLKDGAHPGDDYMVFDDYRITAEPLPPPTARVIYSTSFEPGEGYQTDQSLVGQNGWLSAGSGGDGLITNVFANQFQSAYLGFGAPTNNETFHVVGTHVDFHPLESQLPKVTFSVQMAVFASTTTNQEWFDWAFFNTEGKELFSLEFPTGTGRVPVLYKLDTGDYLATGQSFTNGLVYTLTVSMDFAANRWSANLDSTLLLTNQPIATESEALTLSEIDAQWFIRDGAHPGNDYLVFDEYRVAAEPLPPPTAEVIYSTSFELAEGYQPGQTLVGQNGWQGAGSGGDGLITNVFPSQLQSAYLGFGAPTNNATFHVVGQHVNFHPLTSQLPKTTFSVQMAVFASTTTNQEWFDWAVFNSDGAKLLALEFSTGPGAQPIFYLLGGGDYLATGQSYTNGLVYTLNIEMDFSANRWSANLDSMLLVTNQPIASGSETLTISEISPQWFIRDAAHPGNDYMIFDEYRITAEPVTAQTDLPTLEFKSRNGQGAVVLGLTSEVEGTYSIEASSDLVSWTKLGQVLTAGGAAEFTDPTAGGLNARFYRARQGP